MVIHKSLPIREYSSGGLGSEIVMKIKSIKKFIEFITKNKLNEEKESLARIQFLSGELDDHRYFINKEVRRVK
jgi:hypothetical protein